MNAPVILFVYNRPVHTAATLKSLLANTLSLESDLFIFSDAPKRESDLALVHEVRKLIHEVRGFKRVEIIEQSKNLGLAQSVISGVSAVIGRYGSAIIIEDDLLLSPFFLECANTCLKKQKLNSNIFSMGGYTPAFNVPTSYKPGWFLSYRCCTWGWATWADRWEKVDWSICDYIEFTRSEVRREKFNRGGSDMEHILRRQMMGEIDSWAIRWDYAHFKEESFCLRPTKSLVSTTGNDGSGIHCGVTNKYDVVLNTTVLELPPSDPLKLDEGMNMAFATFYDGKPRDQGSV